MRTLNVFVASPGGLESERAAVSEIAERLNGSVGLNLGVSLLVLRWENSIGRAGRAQAQLNALVDKADIVIGLVHRTWGTPTGDGHDSGFKEEYDRALLRWKKSEVPQISLFFREIDEASKRDPGEQLAKVLDFKREIEASYQAFYNSFKDDSDFKLKVMQLLVEELHRASGLAGASEEEGKAAGGPSEVAQNEPTQLGVVLSDFAAVVEGRASTRPLDRDRLQLFAEAFSEDDGFIGSHLANRLFRRRESLALRPREVEYWLRSFVADCSRGVADPTRTVPLATLHERFEPFTAALEAALPELISDSEATVRTGVIQLIRQLEIRPNNLWPRASARPANRTKVADLWRPLFEVSPAVLAGYLLAVSGPGDALFFRNLEEVAPDSSKVVVHGVAQILERNPSAEGLAAVLPELLEEPQVIARFPETGPIASLASNTIERLVRSSRLSLTWKERATLELVAREAISDDFVNAILAAQSPFGTSWARAASRALFDRKLEPGLTSRLVALLTAHPERSVSRRTIARIAVANQLDVEAADEIVRTSDPEARVTTDQVDLALRSDAEKVKHLALARSILTSTWTPAQNWIDFLASAPVVEQKTLDFVGEEYRRSAAEYLASRPAVNIERSDRQLALEEYRRDSTLRIYDPSGFLRIAEDADLDQLIRESRYEIDMSRAAYLALALEKATVVHLRRLLLDESSEVVVAVLAELDRRDRRPSIAQLKALAYDPRPEVRVAATRMVATHLTAAQLRAWLVSYPEVQGTYYYNVVCVLDWLCNGLPLNDF